MADVKNEKKDIYDYFDLIDQAKTKFFAWLRRSGYTLEYIAERLATTPDDIVLRLRRREKFNERELRILIYLRKRLRRLAVAKRKTILISRTNILRRICAFRGCDGIR